MKTRNAVKVTNAADERFFCFDRYEDVSAILKDRRFGAARPPSGILRMLRYVGLGALANAVETGFLFLLDPPDHTRLRKVIDPFFHSRAIASLQPRVETIVEDLLDTVSGSGEFDLITDVATQLPTRVISEIFGFPEQDIKMLHRWSHDLAPLGDQELHRSALLPGLIAFAKFRRRVLQLVRERKDNPRGDLLSALAQAHYGSLGITRDEVVGIAVVVFTAGYTTTAHLIGSCALLLLRHPEVISQANKHPELIDRVIEEALRLESPIQRVCRVALEDVEIHGEQIPVGTSVRLMISAANRDPDRFHQPEEFDLNRTNARHLAFAAGPHHCFGLHLARLEARVAIGAMLRRFPSLTLANEGFAWREGTKFLGLSKLRVCVGK